MSHPSHGGEWQSFNQKHKKFGADPTNIRLGLASDGFNPFGHQGATYSMWPVLVIPYNMPPNVCTKEPNYMMALLIQVQKVLERILICSWTLLWRNFNNYGRVFSLETYIAAHQLISFCVLL